MATKAKTHMIETQSGVSIEDKFNRIIGTIGIFTQSIAPAGVLYYNGASPLRADFPYLWQWAQDQGLVDNGNAAKFGTGDGVTTFRLPDWRGAFLRMTGTNGTFLMANGSGFAGAALMVNQDDGFQGHWHKALLHNNSHTLSTTPGTLPNTNNTVLSASFVSNQITDAVTDGVNGPPRPATETRPFNIAVNFGVFYE